MGKHSGKSCRLSALTTEAGMEMARHDDYDEDEYLRKPARHGIRNLRVRSSF